MWALTRWFTTAVALVFLAVVIAALAPDVLGTKLHDPLPTGKVGAGFALAVLAVLGWVVLSTAERLWFDEDLSVSQALVSMALRALGGILALGLLSGLVIAAGALGVG